MPLAQPLVEKALRCAIRWRSPPQASELLPRGDAKGERGFVCIAATSSRQG
ncbi:hypothetical protein GS682_26395 [Nostoc sp. B(2019)]|nr:hypothetical protein [Nostoc sp. B(2019)]